MDGNLNYGLILKLLRQKEGLCVRKFSKRIERSVGWLSEIENGTGTARLNEKEFERILKILGAEKQKHRFKTWVANSKNAERVDRTFEGAILKFIRIKRGVHLSALAPKVGLSRSHLSKIENGRSLPSLEIRNRIMKACDYSPESFKNFSSDPIRSKAVPSIYKLQILMKLLREEQIEQLLEFTKNLIYPRPQEAKDTQVIKDHLKGDSK